RSGVGGGESRPRRLRPRQRISALGWLRGEILRFAQETCLCPIFWSWVVRWPRERTRKAVCCACSPSPFSGLSRFSPAALAPGPDHCATTFLPPTRRPIHGTGFSHSYFEH